MHFIRSDRSTIFLCSIWSSCYRLSCPAKLVFYFGGGGGYWLARFSSSQDAWNWHRAFELIRISIAGYISDGLEVADTCDMVGVLGWGRLLGRGVGRLWLK